MIDKYKELLKKHMGDLLPLTPIRSSDGKYILYKTDCLVSKNRDKVVHSMYYNATDGTFSCPVCGWFNKDLVTLCASITGTDEWVMLEKIMRIKLNMDTREVIRDAGMEEFKNELFYQINYDAMLFFQEQLQNNQQALQYLKERGLTDETIRRFNLGYAPKYNKLSRTLKKDFREEDLETVGLIGIDEKSGRAYDIFKDRIMFPIIDKNQQVLGFGGRTLGKSPKKYINTKNTPIFQKSKHLYALNMVGEKKHEHLLVCEGYMDVIALHQEGIDFAVATLGTALTPHHYQLLLQYSNKPVALFDGDDAGVMAAERTLKKIGKLDVLTLPDDTDPDDFIKKHGRDYFLQYLQANIKSWEEYWFEKYEKEEKKGNVFEYFLDQTESIQRILC